MKIVAGTNKYEVTSMIKRREDGQLVVRGEDDGAKIGHNFRIDDILVPGICSPECF